MAIEVKLFEVEHKESEGKTVYPGRGFLPRGILIKYPFLPRVGDDLYYNSEWYTVVKVLIYPTSIGYPPEIRVKHSCPD
jgi:hypothetical protein